MEPIWDADEEAMKLRRACLKLDIGVSTTVLTPMEYIHAAHEVERFAIKRRLTFTTAPVAGGIQISRREDPAGRVKWKALNDMKVGDSIVFDQPPARHGLVRSAASTRARENGWQFMCTREGNAIRVTRLPNDPSAELVTPDGRPIELATRATKYGLERLATQRCINIPLTDTNDGKIRLAVSSKARREGWSLTCRKAPDGASMTVYRLDLIEQAAPAPSPAPAADDEPDFYDDQPDWPDDDLEEF